jgi:hypothetical protein
LNRPRRTFSVTTSDGATPGKIVPSSLVTSGSTDAEAVSRPFPLCTSPWRVLPESALLLAPDRPFKY